MVQPSIDNGASLLLIQGDVAQPDNQLCCERRRFLPRRGRQQRIWHGTRNGDWTTLSRRVKWAIHAYG
jgi:hypothetical protein